MTWTKHPVMKAPISADNSTWFQRNKLTWYICIVGRVDGQLFNGHPCWLLMEKCFTNICFALFNYWSVDWRKGLFGSCSFEWNEVDLKKELLFSRCINCEFALANHTHITENLKIPFYEAWTGKYNSECFLECFQFIVVSLPRTLIKLNQLDISCIVLIINLLHTVIF